MAVKRPYVICGTRRVENERGGEDRHKHARRGSAACCLYRDGGVVCS